MVNTCFVEPIVALGEEDASLIGTAPMTLPIAPKLKTASFVCLRSPETWKAPPWLRIPLGLPIQTNR